jgi:septal ring factor EnvC (AmiA/AmiB activator)
MASAARVRVIIFLPTSTEYREHGCPSVRQAESLGYGMPQSRQPHRRRAVAPGIVLAFTACMPSQQDVQTAQALEDIAVSFNEMRQVQTDQADRLDSLMSVLARQDSVIRTLANLAGVQVAR